MTPSLSVIIPAYNRAASVCRAVASVRTAGVAAVEIVVVDDGSTDDTADRVNALGDDIVYVRQENAGPSAARNRGFDRSRGRFVSFLDSDDHWQPGIASRLVNLLDRCPEVDVVFADAHSGNAESGFGPTPQLCGPERLRHLPATEPIPDLRVMERGAFFRGLATRNLFNVGQAMVRREVFACVGGFEESMRHAEDWELYLRLASIHTFAYWPEVLLRYHCHPGERLSSDGDKMQHGFALALESVLAKCPWLAAGDRQFLEQQAASQRFGHAYAAYDRGQYAEAGRRFAAVPRTSGWWQKSLPYRCLCALPQRLAHGLRSGKHWLARA